MKIGLTEARIQVNGIHMIYYRQNIIPIRLQFRISDDCCSIISQFT